MNLETHGERGHWKLQSFCNYYNMDLFNVFLSSQAFTAVTYCMLFMSTISFK